LAIMTADVAVGRTEGADHAERPEPALRQHREGGRRDQADEQQPEDRQDEHDQRRAEPARRGRRRLQRRLAGQPERGRSVEQDGDRIRGRELTRGGEGELVEQVGGILHQADHVPGAARGVPRLADAGVVEGGHPRRQRDLPGAFRVAARDKREGGGAERAGRILGAKLDRVHRARGEVFLLDHLGRGSGADPGGDRGDVGGEVRVAAGQGDRVAGAAEGRVRRRRRVGGDARAEHGGRHRDGDQREDQQLLAPLPAEQAPGPAGHGAPGRGAAVGRSPSL
jgi:hypothetical protein